MTNERRTATLTSRNLPGSDHQQSDPELDRPIPIPGIYHDDENNLDMHMDPHAPSEQSTEPLSSAYIDSFGLTGDQTVQQGPSMDWLWDMVMNDDANMFNF
jgi:hypothetical protein